MGGAGGNWDGGALGQQGITVLAQREMEKRRSPLVSIPPFRAGIFKAGGSFDPMEVGQRKNESSRPRSSSR